MKNTNLAKPTKLFPVLLAVGFLLFPAAFISNAQTSAPGLNGTVWRVSTYDLYSALDVNCIFEGNNAVTVVVDTDPLSLTGLPRVQQLIKGTYTQRGNSVHMDFSDHTIDVTINGNIMSGKLTNKSNGAKTDWAAAGSVASGTSGSTNRTSQNLSVSTTAYTVSSNNPLLGVWRYIQYSTGTNFGIVKTAPSISKVQTITFNQNGILDILTQSGIVNNKSLINNTINTNWKYVPQSNKTGVLQLYKENKMTGVNNIKWIDKNQFEIVYADTGIRNTYKREGDNPNDFRSLIENSNHSPVESFLRPEENLPVEIGQFKRKNLTGNCFTFNAKDIYPRETSLPCPARNDGDLSQLEGYSAYYNSVAVKTFKFKPSDKSIKAPSVSNGTSIQAVNPSNSAEINESLKDSSNLDTLAFAVFEENLNKQGFKTVKEQTLKNKAGQETGKFTVLQNSRLQTDLALICFSDTYYLEAISKMV